MNDKLKRKWQLYHQGALLAHGVCYREWNLQCLWRHDMGWTAQQMSAPHVLFETFPQATRLDIQPLQEAQ